MIQKVIHIIIYKCILKNILRIFIGVKFHSNSELENIEKFILVANHNSHLDTISILSSLPNSCYAKVKIVAAEDYFGKNKLQSWFSNFFINTILIKRNRDKENIENDPIYKMNKALQKYSLLIFPEGTRGSAEKEIEFKAGVALLLIENPQIPYIPIYMKNMGKIMPKGDGLIVPIESEIVYGKPTYIESNSVSEILSKMKHDIYSLKKQI